MKCSKIFSPMTGEVVGLEQVPDPVFSQKIVGDGMAVIPSEGNIVSPVDGEVISVADTRHAFGLRTADGVELLIHVGLETVHLNGSCFQVFVKPGDQVKVGDRLAEVDLEYLKEHNINPVTPVLVCGGMEGKKLCPTEGAVKAGETVLMQVEAGSGETAGAATGKIAGTEAVNANQTTASADNKTTDKKAANENNAEEKTGQTDKTAGGQNPKKKPALSFNFDFLQKLGKVLMTVIAVMPAAGFMISLGKLVQMGGADLAVLMTIGSTMENIGWAVINNLHILFAIAIGGSWAKERAGGAFAAIITFILINQLHMVNTIWAILIPGAFNVWNMILARTYYQSIPKELREASAIDGATEIQHFFKVMLPVCKPIIAVLALWSFVGMWNSYFDAMIYLNDANLQPLQLVLRSILVQNTPQPGMIADIQSTAEMAKVAEQLKYATIVVSSLPLLVMYPFFQKYFDKGIMVGSVKG